MTPSDAIAKLNDVEAVCTLLLGVKDALLVAQETVNGHTKAEMALKKIRQVMVDEQANHVNVLTQMQQEMAAARAQSVREMADLQSTYAAESRKYADLTAAAKSAYGDVVQRITAAEKSAVVKMKLLASQIEEASGRLISIHQQIESDKQKVNAL